MQIWLHLIYAISPQSVRGKKNTKQTKIACLLTILIALCEWVSYSKEILFTPKHKLAVHHLKSTMGMQKQMLEYKRKYQQDDHVTLLHIAHMEQNPVLKLQLLLWILKLAKIKLGRLQHVNR